MRKKIIFIAVIVVIIILAVAAYFYLRSTSPNGSQVTSGNLPSVATSTISTSTSSFPTGDTFVLGTSQGSITVNNFYKTNDYITDDQQTIVLAENDNYTIVYNRDGSGFIIGLLSGSLQDTRNTAEAAFLEQLGVSKTDACKLVVDERVLDKTSPYDGELIGLSFCPGAVSL